MKIFLGKSRQLTLRDVYRIVTHGAEIELDDVAQQAMEASRNVLRRFVDDRLPIYGVSTQYGDDAYRVHVEGTYEEYLTSLVQRQRNVIRALNCGVGGESSEDVVRATILLRAQALAQGASGVRVELVEALLNLLRYSVSPVIYRYGSVGASGDLIPSSAIALTLIGEGQVRVQGKLMSAEDALRKAQLTPIVLQMKEGLALVNGTSYSTAIAALAVYRLCHLLPLSIAAAATMAEAMLATDSAYEPFVHDIKRHRGQIEVAKFVKNCWRGSGLIRSLKTLREEWRSALLDRGEAVQEHVQDFYSLRSLAHGFGPFYEDLERAVIWTEQEINSANDNPVIDTERKEIHHGANFLSDYIAVLGDQLRADIAKGSTWLHALLGNLIHPRKNRGLPSNLMPNPEKHTGFKTIQLLAASLAIHNRSRSLPVAAVMLPTEGDNQDMVSLGTHSAFDLAEVTENYANLVAIMLFAAAQAIELRGKDKASPLALQILKFVRSKSPFLNEDRPLHQEFIEITKSLETSGIIEPWFLAN